MKNQLTEVPVQTLGDPVQMSDATASILLVFFLGLAALGVATHKRQVRRSVRKAAVNLNQIHN